MLGLLLLGACIIGGHVIADPELVLIIHAFLVALGNEKTREIPGAWASSEELAGGEVGCRAFEGAYEVCVER